MRGIILWVRPLLCLLLFLALIIADSYADEPRGKKNKVKKHGGSSPEEVQVNPDNTPDYDGMRTEVERLVLRKTVALTPERVLDDPALSALSQHVQYDQGMCLYMNLPDYTIVKSMLQDLLPILEDELKKALSTFGDVKGSFSGITVKLIEVSNDERAAPKKRYYISASMEKPVFERRELTVTLDSVTWEADVPHWVMSDFETWASSDNDKRDQQNRLHIDKQKISFGNPLVTIDGLKIPLYTTPGVTAGVESTKFGEIDFHHSSAEDIRLLDYDISGLTVGLPFRSGEYNPRLPVEIIQSGDVACNIDCPRLKNISKEKREEILNSFNKLGGLIWKRLTDSVNSALSQRTRNIQLESSCIPFQFNPRLLGVPFIGITPKHPEIITPETVKFSGAISFGRCNGDQLQQLSAHLIQQHETIEAIDRYLAGSEGADLINRFGMFSIDDGSEGVQRLYGGREAALQPHQFSQEEIRFYTEQVVAQAEKEFVDELPPVTKFILRMVTPDGEEKLISMFNNLESDQERRDAYERYDSVDQRLLFEGYYKNFIRDLTWGLVGTTDERTEAALMDLPENLREYARGRIARLGFYRGELFNKPKLKSARDRDALSIMRDYGLDAVLELDIDVMNLILNGMAPELGQEYIYMLPGGDPARFAKDQVTIVAGKKAGTGSILRHADIQYGIPVVSGITPDGRLTPTIPVVDGEPAVWGSSPLLPDRLVRDGVIRKMMPVLLPQDNQSYVLELEKPKHLKPRYRTIYTQSSDSGGGDIFSLEADPSALMSHFIEPTEGVLGRILQEVDLFKGVKPAMFIVRDGRLVVGYVYGEEKKENEKHTNSR